MIKAAAEKGWLDHENYDGAINMHQKSRCN
jgi:hypothetical protein